MESPDEKIEVTANPGMIKQALMNILLNAAQAIPDNGYVKLSLLKNIETVTIKVLDSGEGIDQKNMKKVFEPFFTTRPEGQGQGLGLSTAYTIVEKHKGKISINSKVGKGTVVTIALPITSEAGSTTAPQ